MDIASRKIEFVNLIEKNQGIIFKVSRFYCDNKNDQEDLFQEIVLQLWRGFDSYNKKSKFSTWMYRVAMNTAITQFRKDKTRKEYSTSEIPEIGFYEKMQFENDERVQLLYMAIDRLNKAEKSIIILYLDEYSYDEISDILGLSATNVGVKIMRIKAKLSTFLKQLDDGF